MNIIYTRHWRTQKSLKRTEIDDAIIVYCIQHSDKLKDSYWEETWNAIAQIPPSGRTLKVVYTMRSKTIKVITAYWIT